MSFPTAHRRSSLKGAIAKPHQHLSSPVDSDHDYYAECAGNSEDMTSQCTDQCIVIACDDPDHSAASCAGVGDHNHCDLACESLEDCRDCNGFDQFLQCCDDFHAYLGEPKNLSPDTYHWNDVATADSRSYRNDPNAVYHAGHPHSHAPYTFPPLAQTQDVAQSSSPTSSIFPSNPSNQMSVYAYNYSEQYHPIQTSLPSSSHTTSPVNSSHSIDLPQGSSPSYTRLPSPAESHVSAQEHQHTSIVPEASHTCMWGNCQAHFSSADELAAHVNSQHLLLTPEVHNAPHPHLRTCQPNEDAHKKFSCLWRDCHEFFPDLVDAPSLDKPHAPYDQFTTHILSHHLGYPGPHLPPLPRYPDDYPKEYLDMYAHSFPNPSDPVADPATDSSTRSDSTPSRPMTPQLPLEEQDAAAAHQCGGSHICHWNDCGEAFDSCDDLTVHLSQVHVGSGKPHYDCYWGQCARNGQKGFTSKQKICRHLQSHTGHRPFQCKLCHQNFSEAATLQQHMRRHTREKPYVCDYPGCGKSFAITGALTIHKRTHNGHKPFKCSYCDRAFAESSNLSKHLRTHTGARPYTCSDAGCNKSFARPDQLTRHMNVHKKRAEKEAASVSASASATAL